MDYRRRRLDHEGRGTRHRTNQLTEFRDSYRGSPANDRLDGDGTCNREHRSNDSSLVSTYRCAGPGAPVPGTSPSILTNPVREMWQNYQRSAESRKRRLSCKFG